MKEWPHASYPPWAHGPGYIVSRDIAKFIVRGHQEMDLQVSSVCLCRSKAKITDYYLFPGVLASFKDTFSHPGKENKSAFSCDMHKIWPIHSKTGAYNMKT